MSTPDFFRSRLDTMVDMRHPLVILTAQLPWARIEAALTPKFERQVRPSQKKKAGDLFGAHAVEFGGGVSNAGRPRLSIRLMVSLLYLKNSFNLSDEAVLQKGERDHQAQVAARSAGVADTAAGNLRARAEQIVVHQELLGARLAGKAGGDGLLHLRPRQALGQHGQRMVGIDHAVKAGAEEVVGHAGPRDRAKTLRF